MSAEQNQGPRPRSTFGRLVVDLAEEKKNLHTATAIRNHMAQWATQNGKDSKIARGRAMVGHYLTGEHKPDENWMTLFALAFELDHEEIGELGYARWFRFASAA